MRQLKKNSRIRMPMSEDFPVYPEKVMIQTISRCNASCEFCPYSYISQDHGQMSESLFQKIIDELQDHKTTINNIMPYLMNEPLMDKDLLKKVQIIKEKMPQVSVHFLTNGFLLDENKTEQILESPVDWVGISFFGIDPLLYEKSMGLPYEKVKNRVDHFVKRALTVRGPEFVLITFFKWKMKEELVRNSIAHWKNSGIERFNYHEGGISRGGNVPIIKPPKIKQINRCNSIWAEQMLHILYNGDVIPCCMDWKKRHILGNLNSSTLEEIWKGPPYQAFRETIRGKRPLTDQILCSSCEMAVLDKRIVMVHPHDIFSPKEPWTIRIKALAKELKEKHYQVTLVTHTLDGFEEPSFEQEGIKIVSFSRKLSVFGFLKKISFLRSLFKNADIVFYQKSFHFSAVPVVVAAWLENKHVHYDWDDNETAIYFSGKKIPSYWVGWGLMLLERLLPKLADTVSYSSENLRKKLISMGFDEDKMLKISVGAYPPSIDKNLKQAFIQQWGLEQFSIIYIGQLHGAQYAEMLLHACGMLSKDGIPFKTIILGDGYDRMRLEKIKEDLNLSNVIFPGSVPYEEVPLWISSCKIAVACFEDNTVTQAKSPLKIVEYLSCGKAIIASDVGEVRKLTNNSALLIPPGDAKALYLALKDFYVNPQKITEYEQRARRRAPDISWKNRGNELDSFLKRVFY